MRSRRNDIRAIVNVLFRSRQAQIQMLVSPVFTDVFGLHALSDDVDRQASSGPVLAPQLNSCFYGQCTLLFCNWNVPLHVAPRIHNSQVD
jgi:hypothetical protein